MKVLLVYPRWNYPTFGEPQEPLGIIYIGAALKYAGHKVTMVDLTVEDIEELDRAIPDADMVGMSSSTALYGRACMVLDRIKERRPDLPVILGGPHATVMPEEAISRGFDAAVIGEGEHAVVEIAEAIQDGRPLHEIPAVYGMKGGTPERGPVREFESDIDVFKDPDRSLIHYDRYFEKSLKHVGMMASRGCPWNCLFCKPMQDKLFGRKIRRRSIERLTAEMASIAESLHTRAFIYRDDTFALAGEKWFHEFEKALSFAGLSDVRFSAQSRVDQVKRPLIESMIRCGLEGLAFGVESGSQKVLDFYRKGIKVEQTIAAFDLCREMGIGTHAFIMLGAPVETKEDLDATVKLVERIRPNSVSVSVTTPAPGTDLYDIVYSSGAYNIVSPEDSDYHYNTRPIKLSELTAKDIAAAEKAILEAVPGTYFREELMTRMQHLSESC